LLPRRLETPLPGPCSLLAWAMALSHRRVSYTAQITCTAVAVVALGACNHDWNAFDPRLEEASGGATTSATDSSTGGAGSTATSAAGGGGAGGAGATGGGGAGAAGAGGPGGGGAGGGGGGGGPVHCGGMSLLADDFSDPAHTDRNYEISPGAAVVAGEAVVKLIAADTDSWETFKSSHYHDLRGDAVAVQLTQMVNTATTAVAFLHVVYDHDHYLTMYQQEGTLGLAKEIDGTWTTLATVPFDEGLHRFWRFREASGTTYWETSSDGMDWFVEAQNPTAELFPMDYVRVELGAGTEGGEVAPGEAHFDDVTGAVAGGWCKTSSLTDNFNDGVRARAWARFYKDSTCSLDETGGDLVITLSDGQTGYCGYYSASAYDLTGAASVIEVPQMLNGATEAQAFFALESSEGNSLDILASEGTLYFRYSVNDNDVTLATVLYSPVEHAWWRLRESAGTTYWETSPDATSWTVRAHIENPIELTALAVEMGAGAYQPEAMVGAVHFDHLNLP
jgi:hypothetical protein